MNDIMQVNEVSKTMSSREMAALCKKRHDNTLLVIRDLENRGLLENSTPQYYNHAQNGQQYIEYISDKRDSLVIVARLSPEFMAAVIDRWQELEANASQPVVALPHDYISALEELLVTKKSEQVALERLALAAPKVAHYDAVADRKTLLNATQVAQSVGIKSAQELNKRLSQVGVYNSNYKRGKAFQAWFIQRGLGEMKQGDTGHMQPLFTTKGQMWVFELLSKEVA